MKTKQCTKCLIVRDLSEFSFSDKKRGYINSKCKKCVAEYFQKYKSKNKKRLQSIWRIASKKYCTTEKRRNKTLRRYGLTEETYNDMYDEQNGSCKICKSVNRLVVDHNHETGFIRGLLCHRCNVGLGHFKDDILIMKLAIEYLQKEESL